jgi:hypothetical protein
VRLDDPAEVALRNERRRESPFAQVAANDWIFGYTPGLCVACNSFQVGGLAKS